MLFALRVAATIADLALAYMCVGSVVASKSKEAKFGTFTIGFVIAANAVLMWM